MILVGEDGRELPIVVIHALRSAFSLPDGDDWVNIVVQVELTSLCAGVEGRSNVRLDSAGQVYLLILRYQQVVNHQDR